MSRDPGSAHPVGQPYSYQLLGALNSIAAELQEAVHGEEKIFYVFQKELNLLGLRGGISELDQQKQTLQFRSVASPPSLKNIFARFEKKSETSASGYTIALDRVDVYRQVTREGRALFVKDTSAILAQVLPEKIRFHARPLLSALGKKPGIYAPLVYCGEIKGMLNIVGSQLTEQDVPTLQAIANHIAVALENARLIEKLESANQSLEAAYERTLEGWVKALDLRDSVTEGHTVRSAETTVRLARSMGVAE